MADYTIKLDDAFGHWLAGFADGEGSFNISKNGQGVRQCVFRIALCEADEAILHEIHARTGLGKVWVQSSPSMKQPAAIWTVSRKQDCMALVELFESFPLRSKRRRDFEVWAQAVREHAVHIRGRKSNWAIIDGLRRELHEGRPQRGRKAWVA